jgi:aspartate carbamoyltransferase catalytic subunit
MIRSKKDIISINDLSKAQMEEVFDLTDEYLDSMSEEGRPSQIPIRGRIKEAGGFILATLFYEPSTRTRLSFESAMIRLGGNVLGTSDPINSSVAKGESIADSVRVIQNYADLIVIRHNYAGGARAAAEYADIPIINGGDGSHEHPTQTLCDLYTLRKELQKTQKSLRDMTILVVGDLKNGRTSHSLVYALARFGANILTMPAKGLELPDYVCNNIQTECAYTCYSADDISDLGPNFPRINTVLAPPRHDQAHSLPTNSYPKDAIREMLRNVDACYVTRLHHERLLKGEKAAENYPIIDRKFLDMKQFKHALVLHPLPRVDELSYDLDTDPRALYFKQMAYSVPIRMALIAKVLGIRPFIQRDLQPKARPEIYSSREGLRCSNPKCVSQLESLYLSNKFVVVSKSPAILRCQYCDTPVARPVVGNKRARTYCVDCIQPANISEKDVILFSSEEQAEAAGFRPEVSIIDAQKKNVA